MKIAVIGYRGFIGSHIYDELQKENEVIGVDRKTFMSAVETSYDAVVFAAGNSSKYKAEQDPYFDFVESVVSVAAAVYHYKCKYFLLISSIDAYENNVYGRHKAKSEGLVSEMPNSGILRICAVVGDGMKKGLVFDILHSFPVRVTPDSYMPFVSADDVAEAVSTMIKNSIHGVHTYTGIGTLSPDEISGILGVNITYAENLNMQRYSSVHDDARLRMKKSVEYIAELAK
jgi:nucleoside-diphosphate-sugar epimerase